MIDTQVKHEQQNYVFIEILYNYWGSLYLRPPDSFFLQYSAVYEVDQSKNALGGVVIAQVNLLQIQNTTIWQ